MLLAPGTVAVELAGPAADVAAPEGMAPLAAAPRRARGRGSWRRASRRPAWATWPRASRSAGLDYEARLGVGTCLVAVERADDVARVRAWALGAGGHAVVIDGPDDLRADPWGPSPRACT